MCYPDPTCVNGKRPIPTKSPVPPTPTNKPTTTSAPVLPADCANFDKKAQKCYRTPTVGFSLNPFLRILTFVGKKQCTYIASTGACVSKSG